MGDAPRGAHGALPGVSTGCAPDGGGLHTRCAPVRHSRRPEGRLPFDLHVLGLPLAFILSQDQTLRCSIAVLLNYSESRVPLHPSAHALEGPSLLPSQPLSPQRAAALCWPQTLNELSPPDSPRSTPIPYRKRVQKYKLLPFPQCTFSNIFHQTGYHAECQ